MNRLPVGYLIKRAQAAFLMRMEEALKPHMLTASGYAALYHLAEGGPQSGAALARASWVTPQTMHRVTTALQARGFVEEVGGEGRAILLGLTDRGHWALDGARQAVDGVEARMTAGLADAQIEQLKGLLMRCCEGLSDDTSG